VNVEIESNSVNASFFMPALYTILIKWYKLNL